MIKSRTYLFLVVSYILVLTIPLIIGMIIQLQAVQAIKTEAAKVSEISLLNLKTVLDGKLNELETTAAMLSYDSTVKSLLHYQTPYTMQQKIMSREMINTLKMTSLYHSSIEAIFLYSKRNGSIFTSSSVYTGSYSPFQYETNLDLSEDQFNAMIDQQIAKGSGIRFVVYEGHESQKILLIEPVIVNDLFAPDGFVIMSLRTSELLSILDSASATGRSASIILTGENKVIMSDPELKAAVGDQFTPGMDLGFDGVTYRSFAVASDNQDWQYITLLSDSESLQKVMQFRILLVVYCFFCATFGILAAFYFSGKNYSPIRRIAEAFSRDAGHPQQASSEKRFSDDFKFIESSLNDLIKEKNVFQKTADRQKASIRNILLNRLFKRNYFSQDDLLFALSEHDIRFAGIGFIMMVFHLDDLSNIFLESRARTDPTEDRALADFIVINLVEELVNQNHKGYLAEVDGEIVCLINYDAQQSAVLEEMSLLAGKANRLLRDNFGIVLSVLISTEHNGVEEIPECYDEVQQLFENKIMIGDQNVVMNFADFQKSSPISLDIVRLDNRKRLANLIAAEDFSAAEAIVIKMIDSDLKANLNSALLKIRFYSLVDTIFSALFQLTLVKKDINGTISAANHKVIDLLQDIDVFRIKNFIHKLFSELSSFRQQDNQILVDTRMARIAQYIDDNISNPDLSLNMVADEFNMHYTYISSLFKKQFGHGLLDYIQIKRIDKAKDLLLKTDCNIQEISQKIGYYNYRTMSAVFKRVEGVTPTTYKRNNQSVKG